MFSDAAKDKFLSWESTNPGLGTSSDTGRLNNFDQVYASLGLGFPFHQMGRLTYIHVFELRAKTVCRKETEKEKPEPPVFFLKAH